MRILSATAFVLLLGFAGTSAAEEATVAQAGTLPAPAGTKVAPPDTVKAVLAKLPSLDTLPKDVVQVSPVVPRMGTHHAKPSELPLGPIYCGFEGKIVCLEFMISQADFNQGKSWTDLKGMDGLPPIDHTNIWFEPNGHEGYEIPHYDIHMYFIPPEVRDAIR